VKRHGAAPPLAAVVMLVIAFLVTACGVRGSGHSHALGHSSAGPAYDVRSTILIRKGVTLAPAAASATPRLRAQQAYAAFARHLHAPRAEWSIPAYVTVNLGLFTLPAGPGSNGKELYTAHDVLAYGFRWHSCYVPTLPSAPRPPVKSCYEWNFLNAPTGSQIVDTYQVNNWPLDLGGTGCPCPELAKR
jgi:hypothetical protein